MSDTTTSTHFDRAAKRQMAALWLALWDSVLVGNQSASVQDRYKRMKDVRPGDLVVDCSTLCRLMGNMDDDRWDGQFVRYIRTEREWVRTVPDVIDLNVDTTGDGYWETFQVCANPDGTEFRWFNAELVGVPEP